MVTKKELEGMVDNNGKVLNNNQKLIKKGNLYKSAWLGK